MRTKGAFTKKKCWTLIVKDYLGNEIINQEYGTLSQIATELGYSYNIIVDMVNKRKRSLKGRYEPIYIISKLSNAPITDTEVIS